MPIEDAFLEGVAKAGAARVVSGVGGIRVAMRRIRRGRVRLVVVRRRIRSSSDRGALELIVGQRSVGVMIGVVIVAGVVVRGDRAEEIKMGAQERIRA